MSFWEARVSRAVTRFAREGREINLAVLAARSETNSEQGFRISGFRPICFFHLRLRIYFFFTPVGFKGNRFHYWNVLIIFFQGLGQMEASLQLIPIQQSAAAFPACGLGPGGFRTRSTS